MSSHVTRDAHIALESDERSRGLAPTIFDKGSRVLGGRLAGGREADSGAHFLRASDSTSQFGNVLQTLARCDGNRTRAARVLGLSVRTLRNKIKLYAASGIDVPAYQD